MTRTAAASSHPNWEDRPWDKRNWSPGRPSLSGFAWNSVDRSTSRRIT